MPAMTREELADRRKKIADAVREGKQIADICKKFGIGLTTVKNACREHNVEIDRKQVRSHEKQPGTEVLRIVAWLIQGYNSAEIAEDAGVTRQYVSQVKQRATEAGVFQAIGSLEKAVPEQDRGGVSDVTKFAVASLALDGETQQNIANTCDLHIATVNKILQSAKAAGLMKFSRELRVRIPKKMKIIAALLDKKNSGTTNHEIAKKLRVHISMVDVVIREMKEAGILEDR
jgi:transposase